MAHAAPAVRDRFQSELSSALSIASKSTTTKTRRAKTKVFFLWAQFCSEHNVSETLSTVQGQELKISYLLVFGLRYRKSGQTNKSVRADTVDTAIAAVAAGITDLGGVDPRKQTDGSNRNHPLLTAFIKALRDQDDPSSRAYPANLTLIRALLDALDLDDPIFGTLNAHIIDLIIVAFYWLLRPAEYLKSTDQEGRSQAFTFRDIHLTLGVVVYNGPNAPLHDVTQILRISHATLAFTDQKNAVMGEQVGHLANSDPFFCPAKTLGRIARRLLLANAPPNTPLHMHYNAHPSHRRWYPTKTIFVTNALRHAANSLPGYKDIDTKLIGSRSLRPGGATALMCANIEPAYIALLGRWKSDAMCRYLRTQAGSYHKHFSQKMLDHGA